MQLQRSSFSLPSQAKQALALQLHSIVEQLSQAAVKLCLAGLFHFRRVTSLHMRKSLQQYFGKQVAKPFSQSKLQR